MSDLTNFTETVNSDNRHLFIDTEELDEVVIGGTCRHVFKLPFKYSEFAKSLSVNYKQGLSIILTLSDSKLSIDETSILGSTIVTVTLTPSLTLSFTKSTLDTYVLLKVTNKDDEVIFDKCHKLVINEPLEY